jgi:hypothetical protein
MPSSTALAGYIGYPDAIHVPPRSMKRIQNAIFDSEQRHNEIDRLIEFQAIETMGKDNITQVTVTSRSVDGRPIGEITCIVYRNGRFKKATCAYGSGPAVDLTLGAAIKRILTPGSIDGL